MYLYPPILSFHFFFIPPSSIVLHPPLSSFGYSSLSSRVCSNVVERPLKEEIEISYHIENIRYGVTEILPVVLFFFSVCLYLPIFMQSSTFME